MQLSPPPETDLPDVDDVAAEAAPKGWRRWLRLLPLVVVVAGLTLVFATGLNRYLSLDALQARRGQLLSLVHAHPVAGLLVYALAVTAVVAFSIPGAMIMTMTGGFLFGPWLGAGAAVIGGSAGATILFLVARTAFGEALRRRIRSGGLMDKIQTGVRAHAFSYLLMLRLFPGIPFWICNIAAGLVHIPIRTYVAATVLGLIPPTLIYASIGSGLGHVFDQGGKPSLGLLFDPEVLLPLLGLAALSVLPVAYHAWRIRRRRVLGDATG
jgi:uncharacterized membrane protein YdjX (TVP38/TMEM64 family)